MGRSICPKCNKKLKWYHLFPVLSFLFLRGRCAFCGKKISPHYVMMELLTGAIFVLIFLNWNFLVETSSIVSSSTLYSIDWAIFEKFLFYIVEATLLSLIFFYDLKYQEIPDRFSLPAITLGLLGVLLFTNTVAAWSSVGIGLVIIVVFFGGQIALSKGQWLGGGDLRLGALMAVLLGYKVLILALMISYVLGALVSIPLIIANKANRKTKIAFGPFLITATLIGLFVGEKLVAMYLGMLGV